MQVTLGGDRLGSGKKQKVELRNYERSTHDLSYTWRNTMATGTLVPFINEVALPGDTFDIDLDIDIKTLPTIGPLFGSYKVQLDVFQCPVRLYNGKLHMNMLNIGMKMQEIYLPQISIDTKADSYLEGDNSQINPSCLYKYLGISGLGAPTATNTEEYLTREFNAIPLLAYWDIYKNYYADKQIGKGYVIHNKQNILQNGIISCEIYDDEGTTPGYIGNLTEYPMTTPLTGSISYNGTMYIVFQNDQVIPDADTIEIELIQIPTGLNNPFRVKITDIFENVVWDNVNTTYKCTNPRKYGVNFVPNLTYEWKGYIYNADIVPSVEPRLRQFDLDNIDQMRMDILSYTTTPAPFVIDYATGYAPYNLPLNQGNYQEKFSYESNQEGLGVKTYQSDLFNNWVKTEWIDGENGINQITAIDTSGGSFTIDTLQLSRKVYDMLNRIAVSGGSYDDWLDAVYTHQRTRSVENPMYMGGLIKELAFQEVISQADTAVDGDKQPLGTLAGKGVMTKKHKGGKIYIKVDEPSIILGIVSLTPRIDYSQGNHWSVNLRTMDDFHKPALDEIGFQELIVEQQGWWTTEIDSVGKLTYKSAGKQPAWINYMTNVNKCYGNFAIENDSMYMTLNRRYEQSEDGKNIQDLTTYIDPKKYNNIFANTRRDAMNFWTQIGVQMIARRKMSAKLMPNL
jgi:hypothetical protein